MKPSKRQLRTFLLTVSRGADRSPLFWWMVEHHAETARAAQGRRMPWAALCAQFAAFGLVDGHGNPPSPEAARRTWRLVKAEMARAQAAPAPPAPPPRPRAPLGWQPPVVTPTPVASPRPPGNDWLPRDGPAAAERAAPPDRGSRPGTPENPTEQRLAELRRTLAERSGH